jgi:TonB-dependent starch-binding outer membrane protein SusC
VFARIGQMMQYQYYSSYKPDGVENGAAVDYWTPENPTNAFPRPNSRFPASNYLYYSSLTYADGSFVKLRDATVGFSLPQSLARRLSAAQLRAYVSGRNLARWTEVPDYDPERGGSISSPMTRAFVTGLDVKF